MLIEPLVSLSETYNACPYDENETTYKAMDWCLHS